MTSNRFHASCCKALVVDDNIFLSCLSRSRKNVTSFFKIYDEKTLATSLFAKIGTINCCNLFVKSGKNARSIVDEILSSKQN